MKTESKQQTNISEERDTLWVIDQDHTNIRFFAKHLIISKITGIFKAFEGKVKTVGNDFSTAEIEFKAEVSSLDTGKKERDSHLLSEDFFRASKYPNIHFKSTSMRRINSKEFEVEGDLTIKDVKKNITANVRLGGIATDPSGREIAGFNMSAWVNRFDFGLNWNNVMDTGGAIVGEKIDIECDIEIVKQNGH
ncbi:MAG: YceI family protein [Sporocytophaga sp.]|uniref:YceI family protein n=1 Tax=Sporocytophaga sp. TaxID=2231183 RepID=UPI001B26EE17|nr:YceI family protein [Sporocytophaga sp.]MBO9701284.1 YceI family protein [Sporocytophaga sp.]